jgi:CorA-like Mg2+ transporter protein.
MNEIMKLLTVISTIFIPLTFCGWSVWHEFQYGEISLEYARTELVFWLSPLLGADGDDRLGFNLLLLAARLV